MKPKDLVKRMRDAIHRLSDVYCLRDPLAAAIEAGLTPPQLHTLLALGRGPLAIGELGRRLDATGPTMTGIVDRLEKVGMVERQRDDEDRRVIRLHLTKLGQTTTRKLEQEFERHLGSVLDLLDDTDAKHLVAIFEKLAALASAKSKEQSDVP